MVIDLLQIGSLGVQRAQNSIQYAWADKCKATST